MTCEYPDCTRVDTREISSFGGVQLCRPHRAAMARAQRGGAGAPARGRVLLFKRKIALFEKIEARRGKKVPQKTEEQQNAEAAMTVIVEHALMPMLEAFAPGLAAMPAFRDAASQAIGGALGRLLVRGGEGARALEEEMAPVVERMQAAAQDPKP